MISLTLLTAILWSIIAAWAATVVVIAVEFRSRRRREGRASAFLERLAVTDFSTEADLSASDFADLVRAGLSDRLETRVAQEVRAHAGDETLLAAASGMRRTSIDDRVQALHVITSGRHPEMYTVLAGALRSPGTEVAAVALRLLRELDDVEAAGVMVEALADGVYSASRIAAALDRMTVDCGDLLGTLLRHDSQTVRFWALLLIGRKRAARWTWSVRGLLTDPSPMVRRAAVEALGRIGAADDRGPVLARFFDPSAMVRVHAARAAAVFRDRVVADALVKLLSDREWIVRAAARESLKALGAVATPAVTRTLWQGDPFAANNAAEVLFLTGAALTAIEDFLAEPGSLERRRIVDRLMVASGPQIVRAINDQLEPGQQSQLHRLLGDVPSEPVRVRSR